MRCSPGRRERCDRGTVTAELAACLPVLVLVVGVAISTVTVLGARVRATDAAREAARAIARGDSATAALVVREATPGGRLQLIRHGDLVTATVTWVVHPLASWLPALTITGSATTVTEP